MKFTRRYSQPGDPFHGIKFVQRDTVLKNPNGSVVYEQRGVWVPEQWSHNAVIVLAQKYFRKAGVPSNSMPVEEDGVPKWLSRSVPVETTRFGREDSARSVFRRIAGHWTYTGWKHGYFDDEESAQIFMDEIQAVLARQLAAPNSPQWFNTGLWWAYGITSQKQELYRVPSRSEDESVTVAKPDYATLVTESYEHPLSYACYTQGVEDKLVGHRSIMDLAEREAKVFKFGGGSGTNFSPLRGEGEPLAGGGVSSGVMSWLSGYDTFAGAIKSGGVTRRAAKMVILDEDHPDILQFVHWKVREEDKVAMLAAGSVLVGNHANAILQAANTADGVVTDRSKNRPFARAVGQALRAGVPGPYVRRVIALARQGVKTIDLPVIDTDWQGIGYQTVDGQNANNTVRLSDDFMRRATTDLMAPHPLYWRTDLEKVGYDRAKCKPRRTIPTGELWQGIKHAAWKSADPGTHYAGTVREWNTVAESGEIDVTNPCAEFVFLKDNGCNLASTRLTAFILPDGQIDVAGFVHVVELMTTALDITATMSAFVSPEIAANVFNFRTLGLGYCDLGGLLMRLGVPYDSPAGRAIGAAMTCIMHSAAICQSAKLAHQLGTFPEYERNKVHTLRVLRNHASLAAGIPTAQLTKDHYRLIPLGGTDCVDIPAAHLLLAKEASALAVESVRLAECFGVRNAQLTNIAPTGTIGPLMDCDTTGAEPDFALVKFKSLAGGGYLKIANQGIDPALQRLGYSMMERLDILQYVNGHGFTDHMPHLGKLTAHYGSAKISEAKSAAGQSLSLSFILPDVAKVLTPLELSEANAYTFGNMTTEGAPHLCQDHYPVFDCANPCGRGKRSIKWEAHIDMVAAVQSWISGGISKTINLPSDATPDMVGDAYIRGWQRGVKCMSVYRDDSKLSQPLSSGDVESMRAYEADAVAEVAQAVRMVTKFSGARRKLPNRRGGYRQKLQLQRHEFYLSTGEYDDHTLGEIFVDFHKEGAAFRSLTNAFCIAVSLGLQHGVPLRQFVDKFTFMRFEPAGPVQGHDRLKNATSIVDLIFRDLAITYLGMDELAHVPAADMVPSLEASTDDSEQRADQARVDGGTSPNVRLPGVMRAGHDARSAGYTGNACPECGNFTMVRAGVCERCENCGATSGCS